MQNENAKFKIEPEKRLIRFSLEAVYEADEIAKIIGAGVLTMKGKKQF